MVLGNLCLLGNTLAMAVYYLSAKQLVQRYSAMCVAAWAYITAAACMGLTAALFVPLPLWTVPSALFGPLAYWVIICSVLGYYVVTWAMQHLAASQVRGPTCSWHGNIAMYICSACVSFDPEQGVGMRHKDRGIVSVLIDLKKAS